MGKVLIDNWNLTNANLSHNENDMQIPNKAYLDFLSAYVLWDDIYYLDDPLYSVGWTTSINGEKIKPLLNPLSIDHNTKQLLERNSALEYRRIHTNCSRIVAQRAIYYYKISQLFKLNYYPVIDRADFLNTYLSNKELWSRKYLLDFEEKEIFDKIYEFNNSHFSEIPFPIMHNLILKNATDTNDYINVAMQLKNNKDVINFRKYMDLIDEQLNNGNDTELYRVLKLIPEIVNEVQKMDRKINLTTNLKIKISPATISMITLAMLSGLYFDNKFLTAGLLCSTLGTALKDSHVLFEKSWNTTTYPKKFQLNFLRTLAQNYLLP